MNQLLTITARNLKQYLRDTGAIFFSLLSMFIVIILMFFFLGDVNVENITDILSQFPGRDPEQDRQNAKLLVLAWTCAGIVSINAVTVTQASLSYMIRDRETGKLASIYTAPVSRLSVAAGYVLAAWTASVIVCYATLLVTQLYCVTQGLPPLSLLSHIRLLGMIAANSFTYASLMYLVAVLVKSEGAWGGLGTIIGTLVGFLGGIYFPIGALSKPIATIMKCTPVIYGTALFRREMTDQICEKTFHGIPAEVVTEYDRIMGMTLTIGDLELNAAHQIGILLICGLIFLAAGAASLGRRRKTDR